MVFLGSMAQGMIPRARHVLLRMQVGIGKWAVMARYAARRRVLRMQANPGPVPGSFGSVPPRADQQIDWFLEKWWVAVPGWLRRYSVYLSEAWADGVYLTIWPRVAALAPLVLFLLFGVLEGAFHWTFSDTIQAPG